jgi:hypothetical protein
VKDDFDIQRTDRPFHSGLPNHVAIKAAHVHALLTGRADFARRSHRRGRKIERLARGNSPLGRLQLDVPFDLDKYPFFSQKIVTGPALPQQLP